MVAVAVAVKVLRAAGTSSDSASQRAPVSRSTFAPKSGLGLFTPQRFDRGVGRDTADKVY